MDKSRIRILLVESGRGRWTDLVAGLGRDGYALELAESVEVGLRWIQERSFNLVLADVSPLSGGGRNWMRQVQAQGRDTQVLLLHALGTVDDAVELMRLGAFDFFTELPPLTQLRRAVTAALVWQSRHAEDPELRSRLRKRSEPGLLTGSSQAIREVDRLAEEVARSDVTVLIEGESGTGKELVARSIHERSRRAGHPFISVNCAALTETLLEAELFGHVKGAFTGAVAQKPGRFQMAHGGTLFLDEICDLSPKGQGDLLRVIEDGTFRMVGGTELVRVDVRILAATNKRMADAVSAGRFREDLFYRLQVVPIELPPLRERREDIPALVKTLLEQFATKHQRRTKRIDAEGMRVLERFAWPGNVRQLRNLIERLVLVGPKLHLSAGDLPDFLVGETVKPQSFELRPGITLADAERALIRETLTHLTRNRAEAARILGISRRALQYKLKRHGLLPARKNAAAPVPFKRV